MSQRILFFEGDGAFADEVRRQFEAMGATVDVVSDGAEGIELAEATRPDLILLTIELPGMNGFLVCKKIKKSDGLKDVPLMILSSEATEETFEQHKKLRTRADDYVRKPIAFGDLLARVQRFVDLRSNGAAAGDEEVAAVEDDDVIVIEESVPPAATAEARAFAEREIDALVGGDSEEAVLELEPDAEPEPVQADRVLAPSRVEGLPVPAASGAAPVSMRPSFIPPQDRVPKLERELDEARDRVAELERSLSRAESRAADAERAAADANKHAAGGSSREFLELREQLNRKDRELIELRDQVTQRDRQLLEAKDQTLGLERDAAEAKEKLVEIERETEKSRGVIEALTADKDGAKKRLDDLRGRLERSETRARELEAEREVLVEEQAAALRAAEAKLSEAIEAAAAERRGELDRLRDEHAGALAESERKHAAALDTARADAASERASALDALRAELERAKEDAVAEVEARIETAVADEKREREAALAALRSELDAKREQVAQRAQDLETQMTLVREQLEEAEAGRKQAEAEAAQASEEQGRQVERIRALEASVGRARAKLGADDETLDRVRKALAIGLGLLEDQKKNRFED